jgi:hypothetical protein
MMSTSSTKNTSSKKNWWTIFCSWSVSTCFFTTLQTFSSLRSYSHEKISDLQKCGTDPHPSKSGGRTPASPRKLRMSTEKALKGLVVGARVTLPPMKSGWRG